MLFPTLPHQTNEILVEVHSIARRSTLQVGWYLKFNIPPIPLEMRRMCGGSWRREETLQTAARRARKSFWWALCNFCIIPISGLPELQRAEDEALGRSFGFINFTNISHRIHPLIYIRFPPPLPSSCSAGPQNGKRVLLAKYLWGSKLVDNTLLPSSRSHLNWSWSIQASSFAGI